MSTSREKHDLNEAAFEDEIFENSSFLAEFDDSSLMTRKNKKNSNNDSLDKSVLNVSALCCDEELSGYDKLTGETWIYPTNYPVRDYQFNIIKAAIVKNTLVSLPTGLGKTFIAAVIMYNFYRWYPLGKIIFTAPTRPLVAQQIEACYNIIGIPPNDTVEMTGHMQVNTRKMHWQSKRVFFATPQVISNDIKSGICPSDKIRCLVIDEAHKAKGNYAYCQIMTMLTDSGHNTFRVLALSATPGSKVEDVINVIKNLHIAHLELRTENCIDVSPYNHSRKITTVIIQLGPELTQLRQQYVEILDNYARRLKQLNILPQNVGNLSKGRIVMLYKEFQNKERGSRHPQHNYIMKDFTVLISLLHALELLIKHGSRVFLNFFDEHPEKSWIQSDDKLTALLERLRDDLGINPLSLDRSILPDGTIPEIPKNLSFGHPKFYKLKEILLNHFTEAKRKGLDTRTIVFCEYRESVSLVHCLLLQCRPLVAPVMFVGQGAFGKDGKSVVSQKQQLRVMRSFRAGVNNTLVATCVAEEGLDVGAVDLIVCFDISTRSPVRLVQRCGRTGRERGGQVYILVTEGREHQTLMECMRQRDGLNKKILQSREVENSLYKYNPRLVPRDFMPRCQKMYICVSKKPDEKDKPEKSKKGQKDLRTMLLGRASSSSSGSSNVEVESSCFITEEEFNKLYPDGYKPLNILPDSKEFWNMKRENFLKESEVGDKQVKLATWLEWQRTLQTTINIHHSKDTEILADLLKYSDAKRFDMPASTQNPTFNTQDLPQDKPAKSIAVQSPLKVKPVKKKTKAPVIKSPYKKDGDIRALFSTATKSTKSYTKLINDLGIPNDNTIPTKLINLLVDLSLDNSNNNKRCCICLNICNCNIVKSIRKYRKEPPVMPDFLKVLKLPDIDLIEDLDVDSILNAKREIKNEVIIDDTEVPKCEVTTNNFDLEFEFDSFEERADVRENLMDKPIKETECNFDIGDIEDIFADSQEAIENKVTEITEKNSSNPKETLGFFGLDSIEDIFADDIQIDDKKLKSPELTTKIIKSPVLNTKIEVTKDDIPTDFERPASPSILSGRLKITSPILMSQTRKRQLSTKKTPRNSTPLTNCKKQLALGNNKNTLKTNESISTRLSTADTSDKSMFTVTQLVDMINRTDDEKSSLMKSKAKDETFNERSQSPIIFTQADKRKLDDSNKSSVSLTQKKQTSLIILDSDSDSDNDTQLYELGDSINIVKNKIEEISSPATAKRKLEIEDNDLSASPYFNKRPKLDSKAKIGLSLQEKVLAAISSNKMDLDLKNSDSDTFTALSPILCSQKENRNPLVINKTNNSDDEKECIRKSNLEMLQQFRRGSQNNKPKTNLQSCNNNPLKLNMEITFDDSDDDFVGDEKCTFRSLKVKGSEQNKSTVNHKVRKKNKKRNSFLDLEAEMSDDEEASGDELSDESIGSIVDFICDDNEINNETQPEDMHAHYLKSVKSPVRNGVFKIPELPKRQANFDVFSQYVEEDAYEMDSFCVDSHIGLTQANDISELELAEMALEEKRRAKKLGNQSKQPQNDDSPVIKRKSKNIRRFLDSDSDDSS